MEKIDHSLNVKIPPLRLYIEDLEEIEAVYIKHLEKCELRTVKYKYESIKELKEKTQEKNKIRKLTFDSDLVYSEIENETSKRIVVSLTSDYADIYSWQDDIKSRGIVDEIKDILYNRISKFRYLMKIDFFWFFSILYLSMFFLLVKKKSILYSMYMLLFCCL